MSYKVNEKPKHLPKYFAILDLLIIATCILGARVVGFDLWIYCLAIYLIFRILFCTTDYTFALLLFLVPNLGIMHLSILGTSVPLLNILICIALVKLIMSYSHKPINKNYLIIIGFVIIYECSHVLYYDLKSIVLLISWSCAVLYASLLIIYSKKTYNHFNSTIYFISGVFISTVYGVLDFYINYGTIMNNNMTIRFKGAAGDPNYYSMYIMIAMFSMLYLVSKESNKKTGFLYPILFVFFVSFGILSLSRMFLIVTTLAMLLLITTIIVKMKKNKKILLFIIVASFFPILLTIYYNEEVTTAFNLLIFRFTDYIDDPSGLTSDRNILAEQYIKLILSNPQYLIWGMGIQNYHLRTGLIPLEAHNIILELFVVWGITGFFVLILFVTTLKKYGNYKTGKTHKNLIGWLPIICLGFSYMSINAMSTESFFLLILFVIKNITEYERLISINDYTILKEKNALLVR